VGCKLNVNDVLSEYAQRCKGFTVESLDVFDDRKGGWREILVEDRTATPAGIAASRIDFQAWLRRLSRPQRRVAKVLASGERTMAAAKRFRLSPARISQLRGELRASWEEFQKGVVGRPVWRSCALLRPHRPARPEIGRAGRCGRCFATLSTQRPQPAKR
jgi:hypothetical protein